MQNLPLNALRAFEATVRLGSATKAAQELSVTQSAVSHQIRELEESLGTLLFIRKGRRLQSGPAALKLAESVREAFKLVSKTFSELKILPSDHTLTISMLPAVAMKWLAPRLTSFLDECPGVDLRIGASRHLVDFEVEQIDAAIRYGRGNWPGVQVEHLADEVLMPVMAPKLLATLSVKTAADLLKFPLLKGDLVEGWSEWFLHAGIDLPVPKSVLNFSDDAALIEAAVAGSGVALGRSVLVADDVRAGRLIVPVNVALKASFNYWFVRPENADANQSAALFSAWAKASLQETARIHSN
jgi:LysR family transcriptional regulator, glycine cleavage system transcriptional activator